MTKPIRIIAGLGNPEDRYERTLHNAGFWFVDALARKYGGNFRYEKKFDADICRINLHGEASLAGQTAELYEPQRPADSWPARLLPAAR